MTPFVYTGDVESLNSLGTKKYMSKAYAFTGIAIAEHKFYQSSQLLFSLIPEKTQKVHWTGQCKKNNKDKHVYYNILQSN